MNLPLGCCRDAFCYDGHIVRFIVLRHDRTAFSRSGNFVVYRETRVRTNDPLSCETY